MSSPPTPTTQVGALNFQQAPPIWVPLRFFLSAPAFALLAAAVMLWQGENLLASRWSPATLAAVHLLTLGSMTMVMIGALFQLLPVLAGAPLPRPRMVAAIVHGALVLGTLMFAGALLFTQPLLLAVAIPLLGLGLAIFLAAALFALARTPNPNASVFALGMASCALVVTLLLGLALGASRTWGLALPTLSLRDLHPAWGLLGWTGLLVAGAAYQIVPMFQITPPYPRWLMRSFAATVCALLTLLSIAQWPAGGTSWQWLKPVCIFLLAGAYILFAAITLHLQRQRRRRLPDVTLEFWRIGMVCVVLAALLWAAQEIAVLRFAQADVLLGVLVILGAAMSFISGMLCKIVPFLSWFHLQASRAGAPNVKAMLPEKAQRLQLRLHLAALVLCVAAALFPALFTYPAALCFGAASLSVLWNMFGVVRIYRRVAAGP